MTGRPKHPYRPSVLDLAATTLAGNSSIFRRRAPKSQTRLRVSKQRQTPSQPKFEGKFATGWVPVFSEMIKQDDGRRRNSACTSSKYGATLPHCDIIILASDSTPSSREAAAMACGLIGRGRPICGMVRRESALVLPACPHASRTNAAAPQSVNTFFPLPEHTKLWGRGACAAYGAKRIERENSWARGFLSGAMPKRE